MIETYLTLFIVTVAFAALLEKYHDLYTPDYIWVTGVLKTTLVGIAFLTLSLLGVFPLVAFWHFLGLHATAEVVIVTWQIWQALERKRERDEKAKK